MGKKPIWEFRIASQPDTTARQLIYLSGATHGNEKIGTEIVMWLADYLLTKYSTDPEVKALVDKSEFLLHPILNADGYIKIQRSLNNGKDPNRAFGWQAGGSGISLPYEWPEVQVYRDCLSKAPWLLSFDYHCGIITLLDPFFAPIDMDLDRLSFQKLCNEYPLGEEKIDNLFILETKGGGISCDGAFGKCSTMAILPEVSRHNPPESDIERICKYNLECILDVITEMQKGVCGRVYDAKTKKPLYARIQVEGNHTAVFTHPKSGAYFKYIPSPSGTYVVKVYANVYKPATQSINAHGTDWTKLDFSLEPDPSLKYYALSVDALLAHNNTKHSEILSCLESPDNKGFFIQGDSDPKGFFNIDFGPYSLITNRQGDDITVHALNNTKYTMSVAYNVNDLEKISNILGQGEGTTSFDLEKMSLDSARFVQISCLSGSVSIDAIEALPREHINKIKNHDLSFNMSKMKPKIVMQSGNMIIIIFIPKGKYHISIYDLKGKHITTVKKGVTNYSEEKTFALNKKAIAGGMYILLLKTVFGVNTIQGLILK